ncbi:hypothetical protein IHQ71_04430 [Rhizobium sp. TH2]|uniref:hypothetical protein n=1 Tax=Rhizobium sp. TH2 TaxID=2775403 RepID=UPI0021573C98|nr:hypothetical protein [Rhizobium sp. TH2]UVC09866.1 hypothetical protein IHQ71_04430 [Rhizobium sp. TH2]
MSIKTRNPAALSQGRAGNGISGLVALDIQSSHSANACYVQAHLTRKFHLQPVVARLVADLAGLGARVR